MSTKPANSIELLDLREVTLECLAQRVEQAWEASPGRLLTVSRRPSKKWTQTLSFARALVLSSAPLYELILWIANSEQVELPRQVQQEQESLLKGYHRLFSGEEELEAYLKLLEQHISAQEAELYPKLSALAPVERALRELGYEHQGLRKGALELARAASAYRAGSLEKKDKDRLDLDFFHLLEHHLEREREAVIPAWILLSNANEISPTKD